MGNLGFRVLQLIGGMFILWAQNGPVEKAKRDKKYNEALDREFTHLKKKEGKIICQLSAF